MLKAPNIKWLYVLSKKDSNHLIVFQQPYLMALLLPEKVGPIKREGTAWCRLVFRRQWTLAKWKHREGRRPRPAPSHINENDRAASAVWQEEGRVTQCRKVAAEYWVLKDPDEGIQPEVLPETLHLPCVQHTNSHWKQRLLSSRGWALRAASESFGSSSQRHLSKFSTAWL